MIGVTARHPYCTETHWKPRCNPVPQAPELIGRVATQGQASVELAISLVRLTVISLLLHPSSATPAITKTPVHCPTTHTLKNLQVYLGQLRAPGFVQSYLVACPKAHTIAINAVMRLASE